MMNVWSWICELPDSPKFIESDSPAVFPLSSSPPSQDESSRSIQLSAEKTSESSDSELSVTFKVILQGFHQFKSPTMLWMSDTCPLSSNKPFLPLLLHLLREIIALSPLAPNSACPRSQLREIRPDPVSWVMDSHSPESFSSIFNLIFLTRLFWSCACDAPNEVGSFFFNSLLGPNIESMTSSDAPVLRAFFVSVGVDAELCITRAVSYILSKWLLSKEIGVGLQTLNPLPRQQLGFSYATEAHGLWILKGYFPILGTKTSESTGISKFPMLDPHAAVLKYALAHQQVEAVIQLEYSVRFMETYIQVNTRVDNIRIHVAKLGYGKNVDGDLTDERHFPCRVRTWVGPEVGSTYVAGISLGRSTHNEEKEIETTRMLKGDFGKPKKSPKLKARSRVSTKTKIKRWRRDQDAEGNAAVFDAVLCDGETGEEVISMRPTDSNKEGYFYERFRNRNAGYNRAFCKNGGGVVFGRDENGDEDEIGWRISKEMEGSVLKWRIGGQVWLSYWPNKISGSVQETRWVEWCDEVDLPLIPPK